MFKLIHERYKKHFTDGCSGLQSMIYRLFTGRKLPWYKDCAEHDIDYAVGGSEIDRAKADLKLMKRMDMRGYPKWARIYHYFVRNFGWASFNYKTEAS